jgi:hypothetical protein
MASTSAALDEMRDRLWKRYCEAYSVAAGVISFGKLVPKFAVVVGVIIFVAGVGLAYEGAFVFGFAVVAAIIVGARGWISGIITMAQGQFIQSVMIRP